MAGASVVEKNPTFVEAGRKGALIRWGEPRIVRLDDLTEDQRRLVRALIEAARAGKAATVNVGPTPEGNAAQSAGESPLKGRLLRPSTDSSVLVRASRLDRW